MYFFSSVQFSAVVLLLLPALFASAHPHLHDRSIPKQNNEIELWDPSGGPGLIATLKLERERHTIEPEGTFYQFNWEAPNEEKRHATATRVTETQHSVVVAELTARRTYITSGIDARDQLWVVEEGWDVEDEGVEGARGTLLGGTANRRGHAK